MNDKIKNFEHTNKPVSKPSDFVTFWHATTNSDVLKSFLDDGAKAIGKGVGGQSSGFYVWNNKEKAVSHLTKFLFKKRNSTKGLIIGTKIKKSEISFPIWQFDLENCYILNPLLIKYQDQIINIKNLQYIPARHFNKDEIKTVDFVKRGRFFEDDLCSFVIEEKPTSFKRTVFFTENETEDLDLYQALINKMCENNIFKQDFDKILFESALDTNAINLKNFLIHAGYTQFNDIGYGFKYCGNKPLRINEIFYIKKDDKGQNITTQIYTSSVCKEKQICPFLNMYFANVK